MNGPQRTDVFCKEFQSYRNGRTEGQKDERTISSSYFRQAVNSLCETMIPYLEKGTNILEK